jgi:hypothetical protein
VRGEFKIQKIFCPSTDFSESTHVLGVRNNSGIVKFFPEIIPIPQEGVEVLTSDSLTNRIRLTGECIQDKCAYWRGHCRLGQELNSRQSIRKSSSKDLNCPIEESCRWRLENGENICSVCPKVMRGLSMEDLCDE